MKKRSIFSKIIISYFRNSKYQQIIYRCLSVSCFHRNTHIRQPQNSAVYERKNLFLIHLASSGHSAVFREHWEGLYLDYRFVSTPCAFCSLETHRLPTICLSLGNDRNARNQTSVGLTLFYFQEDTLHRGVKSTHDDSG